MQRILSLFLLGMITLSMLLLSGGCSDDDNDNGITPTAAATTYTYDTEFNTMTVKDYGRGTGNRVWSSDTTWILDGFVFVNDGQTLTIEPGTVVMGKSGQGANASALIVASGGTIMAQGTAANPIIFTSESDDLDDPEDLPAGTRGLWGGVILLGKARINTAAGTGQIEGIPSTEPRGSYGGTVDSDNSGIFTYCSIRYGGTDIGEGNEINGLTFGAVGSQTTVHHIEVFYNQDDGFEWFGGTVNTKYLVSAFNRDDCFDYDEGFRGMGQYWFAVHAANVGDRGGEHDGGTSPEDGTPLAIPEIRNATYIGSGSTSGNANNLVFMIRDNAGGKYYNSIFTGFACENGSIIEVEDLASGADSRQRLEMGDLMFSNNIWYDFKCGDAVETIASQDFVQTHLAANGNTVADPKLASISHSADGMLDPVPSMSGPAASGATAPTDSFFDNVSYKGAFDPAAASWLSGWTALDDLGHIQ